jgi:hypothetical protein
MSNSVLSLVLSGEHAAPLERISPFFVTERSPRATIYRYFTISANKEWQLIFEAKPDIRPYTTPQIKKEMFQC